MSSSYLKRRTSDNQSSHAPSEDDMQKMMMQKACELFAVCDVEQKGFITKRDMQRLQQELPLTADQLVDVFDSLDDDKNGFLTLEEFTEGFGSFLGITSPSAIEKEKSLDCVHESGENVYEHDREGVANEDDDGNFHVLLDDIGASEVLEDVDGIRMLWGRLKQDQPELLSNFEEFLQRITGELKRTHTDYKSLQVAVRNKSQSHDEEMRKLYEEMEMQIQNEKQKILAEEKAKEKQLKEELEKEFKEKDKQLQELLAYHHQVEQKLQELNSQETETKQENEKLQADKQELEDSLEESQRHLDDSRSYINQLRSQQKEEKRNRALAALHVTEGIAIERETLVKQLDLLRDMNRKLRDERDEAELRRLAGSQDMGEFSEFAPNLSRVSSIGASQREADSALDSYSVSSAGTEATTPGLVDNELMLRRQHLMKRGSVLSNYINDSTWRPNYESDIEVDEEIEYEEGSVVTSPSRSFEGKQSSTDQPNETFHTNDNTCTSKRSHRNRNADHTDGEDVGYSGMDSDHEGDSSANQRKSYRQSMRLSRRTNTREQPIGANSSTETTENRIASHIDVESATPERIFKVVFVGDSGVGKSSFIHQFCNNNFKTAFQATIGVDFQIKNLRVDNHIVAIQVWDTAGQERFRSITKQYFRKADGVLVMYDVTCETSFRNVRNWMTSVQDGTEDGTVLLIAGNKMDLVDESTPQAVSNKDGTRLADEFGSLFYETSAKSGLCVYESVEAMAKLLCEREDQEMEKALQLSESTPQKRGCCK